MSLLLFPNLSDQEFIHLSKCRDESEQLGLFLKCQMCLSVHTIIEMSVSDY